MVLVQDIDYVLLDELLNNLDMKYVCGMMWLLVQVVCDLGKMVIVVLYDINFVFCYVDWIVVMLDGKVFVIGVVDQIVMLDILLWLYDMDIFV